MPTLPKRRTLDHEIPPWVESGAVYFITVNALPKGENQLCRPRIAEALLDTAAFRHANGSWHLTLFLLMPDHVHMLAAFPEDPGMQPTVSAWKRYTARTLGIRWQRDFFDHRIRSHDSVEQKAEYIRDNPVRSGLVVRAEDWPYALTR